MEPERFPLLARHVHQALRLGLCLFAVVHVGLHWLYRRHPAYEFNNPSSWALIVLAGLFGAAYVAAVLIA